MTHERVTVKESPSRGRASRGENVRDQERLGVLMRTRTLLACRVRGVPSLLAGALSVCAREQRERCGGRERGETNVRFPRRNPPPNCLPAPSPSQRR